MNVVFHSTVIRLAQCSSVFQIVLNTWIRFDCYFLILKPADCKVGTQYKGSSGYQKITGSKCTGDLYPAVDRDCSAVIQVPDQGTIRPPEDRDPSVKILESTNVINKILYLEKSNGKYL
jgi:hypothetical protein